MTLTRTQRRNLDKLATYLEGLPKGYKHFGMSLWMSHRDWDVSLPKAVEVMETCICGTIACAVGHGPSAGVKPFKTEDWTTYAERVFGADRGTPVFSWAFHEDWASDDDHHWGAAARIRYLLKHGAPPEGFAGPRRKWREAYREFDKRHAKVAA